MPPEFGSGILTERAYRIVASPISESGWPTLVRLRSAVTLGAQSTGGDADRGNRWKSRHSTSLSSVADRRLNDLEALENRDRFQPLAGLPGSLL